MQNLEVYPNVTGTFPNVLAIPNTTTESNDGTPLTDVMVNNFWGVMQAIMFKANITPSGDNETSSLSQILQGLRRICGNPGEVVYWSSTEDALIASGARLLPLYGQVILISSYPDLVEFTYVGDTQNDTAFAMYKSSDSSGEIHDINGDYFVLPDYRNMFVRVTNDQGSPSARKPHELEEDIIKAHTHQLESSTYPTYNPRYDSISYEIGASSVGVPEMKESGSNEIIAIEQSPSSTETRPINMNMIICVRY